MDDQGRPSVEDFHSGRVAKERLREGKPWRGDLAQASAEAVRHNLLVAMVLTSPTPLFQKDFVEACRAEGGPVKADRKTVMQDLDHLAKEGVFEVVVNDGAERPGRGGKRYRPGPKLNAMRQLVRDAGPDAGPLAAAGLPGQTGLDTVLAAVENIIGHYCQAIADRFKAKLRGDISDPSVFNDVMDAARAEVDETEIGLLWSRQTELLGISQLELENNTQVVLVEAMNRALAEMRQESLQS